MTLLDFFWGIIIFYFWFMVIWIFIRVFADIFRRRDLSGVAKVAWTIALLILPFLGALVYMLLYGRGSTERKKSTRNIGLALSGINLVLWIVITAWYFRAIHGK